MKLKNLLNQTFGRLKVIERAGSKDGAACWLCSCGCGNKTVVLSSSLLNSKTKSCGCLQRESVVKKNTKHGLSKTREYAAWVDMISRCESEAKLQKRPNYKEVEICQKWRNSFESFLSEMGPAPGREYTLERIDNSLGYCQENCRWATKKEQARNKSNNRFVTYLGQKRCVAEWCELLKLPYNAIRSRILKGWAAEDAFTVPVRGGKKCLSP